jgi:hypothetical protein
MYHAPVAIAFTLATVIILGLLWASGRTALSRTSRAAAYVIAADMIEGSLRAKPAWAKQIAVMLSVLLIHALGVVVFLSLCVYLVWYWLGPAGMKLVSPTPWV